MKKAIMFSGGGIIMQLGDESVFQKNGTGPV